MVIELLQLAWNLFVLASISWAILFLIFSTLFFFKCVQDAKDDLRTNFHKEDRTLLGVKEDKESD